MFRRKRKASTAIVKVEDVASPDVHLTPDEREFRELYRHLDRFVHHARGQHLLESDVHDVVHDMLSDMWQRWPEVRVHRHDLAWFYKAINNRAASLNRRNASSSAPVATPGIAFHAADLRDTPDFQFEFREFDGLVASLVAQLPDRARQAYLLVREAELSYAAAAEIMGITKDAVKKHLGRAHTVLQLALAEAGYDRGSLTPRLTSQFQARLGGGGIDTAATESVTEDTP